MSATLKREAVLEQVLEDRVTAAMASALLTVTSAPLRVRVEGQSATGRCAATAAGQTLGWTARTSIRPMARCDGAPSPRATSSTATGWLAGLTCGVSRTSVIVSGRVLVGGAPGSAESVLGAAGRTRRRVARVANE
jgi:hypothetical protein